MPAQPTPSRTEAFSDGVIAVIITIMVLELKVPHAPGLRGFVTVLPTLAVYLLSFVFTGIYWVNHHHLIDRLEEVDTLIFWTNLGLLFSLSLLPFFTNYMVEKTLDSFSVSLYAAELMLCAVSFEVLSLAVDRHNRQSHRRNGTETSARAERHQHHMEFRKGLVSLAIYMVGIGLAHLWPQLTLGLLALVTIIWIVPTFGTRKLAAHAATHATPATPAGEQPRSNARPS